MAGRYCASFPAILPADLAPDPSALLYPSHAKLCSGFEMHTNKLSGFFQHAELTDVWIQVSGWRGLHRPWTVSQPKSGISRPLVQMGITLVPFISYCRERNNRCNIGKQIVMTIFYRVANGPTGQLTGKPLEQGGTLQTWNGHFSFIFQVQCQDKCGCSCSSPRIQH